MTVWNPWHGCIKYSEGCAHCYVYRRDAEIDRDASLVTRNKDFSLPVAKTRDGSYKIPSGELVYACLTSDFFLDLADDWRTEAWKLIRTRSDLRFVIITKRISRFPVSLPSDWGDGYDNVCVCVTCENQRRADERLPLLLSYPIKHRMIICEPLLAHIDLSRYLTPEIEQVIVGGESGDDARVCDYSHVLSLRAQCMDRHVPFHFKQTGALFLRDGVYYKIERKYQQTQAKKANIDYRP